MKHGLVGTGGAGWRCLGKVMGKKKSKYRGQRPHLGRMRKSDHGWSCVRLVPGCGRCVAGPMDGICQLWHEPHQHSERGRAHGAPGPAFSVLYPARTCPACHLDGEPRTAPSLKGEHPEGQGRGRCSASSSYHV